MKLSKEDIIEIKRLHEEEGKTQQEIADIYGVSREWICKKIKKKKTFPVYDPNHPLEKLRVCLVDQYTKKYYRSFLDQGYDPDLNEIWSYLTEYSIKAISTYDDTKGSFKAYADQKFSWFYMDYGKKLLKLII